MSAHTPGPWRWFNYPDGRKLLAGSPAAVIHCPDAPMTVESADANLIAAAPELLEACKDALNAVPECNCPLGEGGRGDAGCSGTCSYALLTAAIAKAEGR